ncbi:MAG: hypothetical protein NVS3B14_19360 [Ktedonobacteraceae bacterium]
MDTDTAKYSDVVGVFRERSNADQAIDALKQAGFAEDQIQLTEYQLRTAVEAEIPSLHDSDKRIIVHVNAEGREQEAVEILTHHGANNADIPAGTTLVHASIVGTNAEAVDIEPGQPPTAGAPDSNIGGITQQDQPVSVMDDPNIRRA